MITCAKCGNKVGVIGPCRKCAKAATAPKMTRADALAEARKRWGQTAKVCGPPERHRDGPYLTFTVGVWSQDGWDEAATTTWHGEGVSWEAAFADADERGNR